MKITMYLLWKKIPGIFQITKKFKIFVDLLMRKWYYITCDVVQHIGMRKCRNWQTSKTKDLVAIAVVWVQVPSSALIIEWEAL